MREAGIDDLEPGGCFSGGGLVIEHRDDTGRDQTGWDHNDWDRNAQNRTDWDHSGWDQADRDQNAQDQRTGQDGWLTLTVTPERDFPALSNDYNLQFYVKAYRQGDPVLAGVAGTRLVQVPLAR